MRYAIADLLTDDEKARALAGDYERDQFGRSPRTRCGHCALSLALGVSLRPSEFFPMPVPPGGHHLAEFLFGRAPAGDIAVVDEAVCDFVDAFDAGLFPTKAGLADALGVPL